MQEALSSQPSTPNKTKPDNNNTKVRSGSRLHKHETLQKKKKKKEIKGTGRGSNCRAPTQQEQGPGFKSHAAKTQQQRKQQNLRTPALMTPLHALKQKSNSFNINLVAV
jgi:hypothetical protein